MNTETAAFPLSIKILNDAGHIEGLAAAFGNVDLGGDRIIPGAFAKTLASRSDPIPMLLHHDLKRPIGRWDRLVETPEGLEAKGRITLDTRDGQEAYALARDGALRGLSIGYRAIDAKNAADARNLHELDLHEVSLVTVPMNPKAQLSAIKSITNIRDLEELLRAGGFSGRKAKVAAGAAWRAINDHPDPDETKLADILTASSASLSRFYKD